MKNSTNIFKSEDMRNNAAKKLVSITNYPSLSYLI